MLEECIHSENDKKVSLEYCKVLLYLGEATRGLAVVEALISQSSDKDPFLYLLAGAMHSILGQYKEAGECFFESIQCGPPRLFHRSDMMFVLSRSCELMEFESRFSNDDGYSMVATRNLMLYRLTLCRYLNTCRQKSALSLKITSMRSGFPTSRRGRRSEISFSYMGSSQWQPISTAKDLFAIANHSRRVCYGSALPRPVFVVGEQRMLSSHARYSSLF